MIICPRCSRIHGDQDGRCIACGASLLGITPDQTQEQARRLRAKRRLQGHLLTGAILCFALPTLIGLPFSLRPLQLASNLLFGAVFGVPLGYLVSAYARTAVGGALIGCGVGLVYCAVGMLLVGMPFSITALLAGMIIIGVVPGAIMGWHVGMDR